MGDEPQQLHVVLFPFMAQGHMLPILDIAGLFAARGIPAQEVGLPEGCQNLEEASKLGLLTKFLEATEMLSKQLEQYLEMIVFHATGFFSLCVGEIIWLNKPYKNVSCDEEPFFLPCIPHEVQLTRSQLPENVWKNEDTYVKRMLIRSRESELKSYGVIVNSFYELEPHYADIYRKEQERRAWNIGPVSMCNKSIEDKAHRGKQASTNEHECLKWLNFKKPDSVIYICFGSLANFIGPQLHEIAMALEASGQEFIWVVRTHNDKKSEEWLPPKFEQQMEGKGLIIRGWAPQLLILEHEAIGAFVTHCGWNSTLEGISSGVPMVTWPIFAEQFYNEKLVTQILKTGVPVRAKKWSRMPSIEYLIKQDAIQKALTEIMVGKEAEEKRNTAKKLKEMAWKAVAEGGSSYSDLSALINELQGYHLQAKELP
ncbi:hypothetical protein SOVF_051160 [Spinacia oleracea]|nr:hypothetical protein SOVF_051160 [Spinacia oleracea]